MNGSIKRRYLRYREEGASATHAIAMARTDEEWANEGGTRFSDDFHTENVRVACEPESEMYDDSFLECNGWSKTRIEREKKELWRLIERDGVWWYFSQARLSPNHPWEYAGSLGMVVGRIDTWSRASLRREALDLLDKMRQEEADELAQRATYAGVV